MITSRIEAALSSAVLYAAEGAPPKLSEAFRYAVFPGGARIRPRLCAAVAAACGEDLPELTDAAAAALELLHCASLVHDDLPCFDDADLRRGRPAVHRVFGEAIGVLVGDGLIVLAFETLARSAGASAATRVVALTSTLARAVGSPRGLVAGQAWESEPAASIRLDSYHRAKTGSLFMAATMAGAICAGRDPAPWREMGEWLGQAYQVADDLLDSLGGDPHSCGKPTRQDEAHVRPNAVRVYGVDGAVQRLRALVDQATNAVPPDCPGRNGLQALTTELAERLVPARYKRTAA